MNNKTWSDITAVYFDSRMVKIFLLGIISGFPWVLIGSSLSLWLKEDGLSRSTIGWAGLIFGVYAINFLWAPLIDRLRIPFLTSFLGHRRGWIIVSQLIIVICLLFWSILNPTEQLWLVIGVGLVIAIASATQDITIDALRIEQIEQHETLSMAAGAAIAVVGWWTGYKVGGIVALYTAVFFRKPATKITGKSPLFCSAWSSFYAVWGCFLSKRKRQMTGLSRNLRGRRM